MCFPSRPEMTLTLTIRERDALCEALVVDRSDALKRMHEAESDEEKLKYANRMREIQALYEKVLFLS